MALSFVAGHTTTRAVTARLVARQDFSADVDSHSVSATSLGNYIPPDIIISVATRLTYLTLTPARIQRLRYIQTQSKRWTA